MRAEVVERVRQEYSPKPRVHHSDREVRSGGREARNTEKGKASCEPKQSTYYVHPEYKMPEESKEQLEDAVAPGACAWEFKGDETMHPFWAVEFLTEEERRKAQKGAFNLKFEDKEFSAVTVGASGGSPMPVTFTVVVAIMTNAVDVKKGEELFLENPTKKENKRKEGSWKTDVTKTEKAPKARAKAKTAASSLEVVAEI